MDDGLADQGALLVGATLSSFFYLTYFIKMNDSAGVFMILLE